MGLQISERNVGNGLKLIENILGKGDFRVDSDNRVLSTLNYQFGFTPYLPTRKIDILPEIELVHGMFVPEESLITLVKTYLAHKNPKKSGFSDLAMLNALRFHFGEGEINWSTTEATHLVRNDGEENDCSFFFVPTLGVVVSQDDGHIFPDNIYQSSNHSVITLKDAAARIVGEKNIAPAM